MESEKEYSVSIKEHFDKILEEKDKAISIALSASEKASLKTKQAQRDYNATHNDLLRKMDERDKKFITRGELWAAVLAIGGLIIAILSLVKK